MPRWSRGMIFAGECSSVFNGVSRLFLQIYARCIRGVRTLGYPDTMTQPSQPLWAIPTQPSLNSGASLSISRPVPS